MNVKRGLFRVWVLVSVAWVALIGLFAYEDSGPGYIASREIYFKRTFGDGTNPFEKYLNDPLRPLGISMVEGAKSTDYTYSKDGFAPENSEALQTLIANEVAGRLYKIRLDEHPQFTLFVPTGIHPEERDRQIDRVNEVATRITELVTTQKRKKVLWNAVKAGIGVPLGILVVGAGIYWAVAGFARAPKQSS